MTMFTMSPTEARAAVIKCISRDLVPFLTSSPGLGKSALVKQIADEYGLTLIDLRLSQCAPEDLMGLPMRSDKQKAFFAPFEMFPLAGEKVPEGSNGWLLFLDEFNSASKSVQAAAYKLALDKEVGQEKLHEQCAVVCAGNLSTDRAIVNQMSTAMQSRLIHMEMHSDHRDFMRYAVQAKFDYRILGFLEFAPSKLHSFSPDHSDRTFACPRTWEFASKLIEGDSYDDVSLALLAGTLSDGVAVEFHTFMEEFDKLPSYSAIIANPKVIEVPNNPSTCYALVTMLLEKYEESSFDDVLKYLTRFSPEFQVVYFRSLIQRYPTMRRNKAYTLATQGLTNFLTKGDEEVAAAA